MSNSLLEHLSELFKTLPEDKTALIYLTNISMLKNYIDKEKEEIESFLKDKNIWFDPTNNNYWLKLVFEREDEAD